MDRNTAVTTWRDVCGSDTVMASGIVTGRMLEEFATRIEAFAVAAERERLETIHNQAMEVLRQIASMPRRTREQRLASACVSFLDSLAEGPNVANNRP